MLHRIVFGAAIVAGVRSGEFRVERTYRLVADVEVGKWRYKILRKQWDAVDCGECVFFR